MPITVAMYEKSLEHIEERLHALGLDLEIVTFDKTGQYLVGGLETDPADVSVDYLWLSSHVNTDSMQREAFDLVLSTKFVGVLQTFNAGLDNPFYKRASKKGIRICKSSAQGVAIAEFVLGQVLAIMQPIEVQRQQQADRVWKITRFREISRTHWLIVGFGPIGKEVAKRVKAFGAEASVVRRASEPHAIVDRVGTSADLPAFLPEADVIVLACALNDTTRGMADTAFFDAVKPGAILVNIARGGLIDDAAMISALDAGRLETAILDVFHTEPLPTDDPLWAHPGVRLTPHTSFGGDGVQGRWDQLFLDNIARFTRGEPLNQEVNPKDI